MNEQKTAADVRKRLTASETACDKLRKRLNREEERRNTLQLKMASLQPDVWVVIQRKDDRVKIYPLRFNILVRIGSHLVKPSSHKMYVGLCEDQPRAQDRDMPIMIPRGEIYDMASGSYGFFSTKEKAEAAAVKLFSEKE